MIKIEQVYRGTIKKCTKYDVYPSVDEIEYGIGCDFFGHIDIESEPYKENAILIKIENGGYIDLDTYNSFLDYYKVCKDKLQNGWRSGGLMLPTIPSKIDDLFVDYKSLKPYLETGTIKKSTTFSRYCVDKVDVWIGGPDANKLIKNQNGSTDYLDYQSEVFRENAILVKLPYNDKNGKELYIDLGNLDFNLWLTMRKKAPISTVAYGKNSLFVDEKTLMPYYPETQKLDESPTRQLLKKENQVVNK